MTLNTDLNEHCQRLYTAHWVVREPVRCYKWLKGKFKVLPFTARKGMTKWFCKQMQNWHSWSISSGQNQLHSYWQGLLHYYQNLTTYRVVKWARSDRDNSPDWWVNQTPNNIHFFLSFLFTFFFLFFFPPL